MYTSAILTLDPNRQRRDPTHIVPVIVQIHIYTLIFDHICRHLYNKVVTPHLWVHYVQSNKKVVI